MTVSASVASLLSSSGLVWVGADAPEERDAAKAALAAPLDGVYTVAAVAAETVALTHLDTVDARLAGAGMELVHCTTARILVLVRPNGDIVEQPAGRMRWPAQLDRIPAGTVRDAISRPVWVRALLPFEQTSARGWTFAVLNTDAKTVARVTWWSIAGPNPPSSHPVRIHVSTLRGYGVDAAAVTARLTNHLPVETTTRSWLDDRRGRDASAGRAWPDISTDQPADLAVAERLLSYLDDIEVNVAGVIADIDTEYLHDLRVAVRRTRSVLKALGDVLPDDLAQRTIPEFRWLGQVTTPTRDLDVYLLGMTEMASSIDNPADLEPFADHVRRRRIGARRQLVSALQSARFTSLCEKWRADLESVVAGPAHRNETVAQLGDQRLHHAFTRTTKRASAITADSPAAAVHSLRGKCKEMRYLLEVFEPVCDRRAYKQVIGDFKDLQNVLGEFQDGEVQANALRVYAQEMMRMKGVPVEAVLAMGELSGQFAARQRAARAELNARHDQYLGKRARQHVDRLVTR